MKKQDFVINGKHNKPIVIDVTYLETNTNQPVIIFCHGYKGFKDWGAWNLMAEAFAQAGFFFVKFNFSHNGGTVEQPIDFPDLEAFGNNNYTKELDDLQSVLNWCIKNETITTYGDVNNISLLGHSRGGGIVTVTAFEDNRVQQVISLAGISDFIKRSVTNTDLEDWKKTGVKYVVNGRTKQQMPHFYQFYLDTIKNKERLNIKKAVSNLKIPYLIIHGNKDTSIFMDEAENLNKWSTNSSFAIINDADHVFNARHPWEKNHLPKELGEAIEKIILFLRK
ncbi:alpha/beta hydrolase family protein [Seonamhaeicola marinus]|uniref:Alpha/beta fold hydrolase n=1 Tax=Seonamhaeicola marinus TaxID=1912246 RepID=A0A5D0HTH5_9FLAO|nr:alpha/beta fold hydrolase [Seonamhaeicola marinus]TYA74301.1 alpha/beta fold hydrolase [Seonamhaeicola marinus]